MELCEIYHIKQIESIFKLYKKKSIEKIVFDARVPIGYKKVYFEKLKESMKALKYEEISP